MQTKEDGVFKVIIAGGREFSDYDMLRSYADKKLERVLRQGFHIVIVSGHARGADTLGERYAKERGYELHLFPANWDLYGYLAGPLRNTEMANYADALIAFWDGKSVGTMHMIREAKKRDLVVGVKHYDRVEQEG